MGLLLGEKLPKISDIGFRTVESKKVSYMMIVWYLLNPSFLNSIIFTIEISHAYYPSFLFSFPQKSPLVFNNRESLLHPGNLAVSNNPADSQIKIVLESKKTLKRP